jgi:hypothetical protein
MMIDWEARFDAVVLAVWETWTCNGARMDAEEREETLKTVRDAATNSYVERIDDGEWQAATLALLRVHGA